MARNERLAIVDDQRVASLGEPARSFPRAASPVNDVGSSPRGRAVLDDVEDRLQEAFERRLLGPLSEIVERASLLEYQADAVQAEQLRAVKAIADRESAMLREMLAFVQSAMWGGIRISRRRVDLRLLCERVVDAIQGSHPDRSIAFVSSSRIEGEWDADQIASLLSTLVLNALEHGAPNKTTQIRVHAVDDAAVIEVASAGLPLDDEVMGRLFEPFNCGHPRHSDGVEGLGLGLYLANEIARAHSGRIEVRTDAAKGTTFRVTMPRA
jgi:sigma-B regulation protein RsbU (phosphoserine phosphatase)